MHVKIFEGSGKSGIAKVEKEINAWLQGLGVGTKVVQMSTAASSVKDPDGKEIFQHLIVTFLCS
jgi:type IV pilus biogenesis protein CpaD/CtpE